MKSTFVPDWAILTKHLYQMIRDWLEEFNHFFYWKKKNKKNPDV